MVRVSETEAQVTAQEAVGFLISSEDLLHRFLAATGVDPLEIRPSIGKISFLRGVMQFLIEDEPLLLNFASATDRKPEIVAAAALALGVRWDA